ncbi:hypothetical protein Shyhy02_24760 [Streptomyces hygroscopicus subsp. hygroscopicus]|nr:hypothetical protein Shyhy02_24760 [Streptomyces hygroscopicus subsp. hygroscopicus]
MLLANGPSGAVCYAAELSTRPSGGLLMCSARPRHGGPPCVRRGHVPRRRTDCRGTSAADVALAALAGCTLPGDTSAASRYVATDITEPFVLADGHLEVPTGPGLGVEPLPGVLEEVTTSGAWIPLCALIRPQL